MSDRTEPDAQHLIVTVVEHDECCSNSQQAIFYGITRDDDSRLVRFTFDARFADILVREIEAGNDPEMMVWKSELVELRTLRHTHGERTAPAMESSEAVTPEADPIEAINPYDLIAPYEQAVLIHLHMLGRTKHELDKARDTGEEDLMRYAQDYRSAEAMLQQSLDAAVIEIKKVLSS